MNKYVKILLPLLILLPTLSSASATRAIFIGRGEQKSINVLKLGKFSIGNKDILSHKLSENKGDFIIKGKKVGFSDLILWDSGIKKTFHIYVIDKRRQLKIQQVKELLKYSDIAHHNRGNLVITTGVIDELQQYRLLKRISQEKSAPLLLRNYFSQELRNKIIAKVYQQFMGLGFYDISCEEESLTIICSLNGDDELFSSKIKFLEQEYYVKFIQSKIKENNSNFKIKLKFVQFERLDGREFSFGAGHIQTTWGDIFESGINALIKNNRISLSENNISVSTLAEPEITLQLGEQGVVKVGSEISYNNINTQNSSIVSQTSWKFAGLSLKIKITKNRDHFILKYVNELSSPEGQNIKGSKESATLLIPINKSTSLFKVAFRSQAKQESKIPLIGSIPLLGKIFSSSNNSDNFKHIYGYVKVEHNE